MLQALTEDMSLSERSMPLKGWQKSSCTAVPRHVDSVLAHPLCQLCRLFSVRTCQTRSKSLRWVLSWCLAPTHGCLLKRPQTEYPVLYICYGFSIVLWWKVSVLQDRMSSGGVAPWWKELCLFGMGWELGVWLLAHKMALTDSFSHWICDACRSLGHLFSARPFRFCPFLLPSTHPSFNFFQLHAQRNCRCGRGNLSFWRYY